METFEITATVPTVQYGNIQPKIVVEAETYAEAKAIGLQRIEEIWRTYASAPLKKSDKPASGFVEIETFTGEKVLYNSDKHEYTDLQGNHLISGSEYAGSFEKPFDTQMLSGKVGTKYGVDSMKVADMWAGNSKISTTFGTALHLAMEQWFKFKDQACDDKEYNLAKPSFLREAVKSFPLKDEMIRPEIVVSDVKNKMAGTIDGLWILKHPEGVVIDYKSDSDIKKNLPKHFKQLSYYAKILQNAGWSIGKVQVYNYTDKWEMYESDVLEINNK